MTRILLALSFVLMFSASAHAIMARPNGGGTADRMVPAHRPPQVMCTQEAKMCPDGSAVGRTGPHCEFAPCPGEQTGGDNGNSVAACTKDAKTCADGSSVGRVAPSCNFAPCPGEEGDEEGSNPDDVVSSPPVDENGGAVPVPQQPLNHGGIACPMLAKVCPDGSSVSPSGPNCEMPPCPGETSPGETSPGETPPGEASPPEGQPGGTPGVSPGNPGPDSGEEGQ